MSKKRDRPDVLEIEITPEMIEARINALNLRGYVLDDVGSIDSLRLAVEEAFVAMVEIFHQAQNTPDTE